MDLKKYLIDDPAQEKVGLILGAGIAAMLGGAAIYDYRMRRIVKKNYNEELRKYMEANNIESKADAEKNIDAVANEIGEFSVKALTNYLKTFPFIRLFNRPLNFKNIEENMYAEELFHDLIRNSVSFRNGLNKIRFSDYIKVESKKDNNLILITFIDFDKLSKDISKLMLESKNDVDYIMKDDYNTLIEARNIAFAILNEKLNSADSSSKAAYAGLTTLVYEINTYFKSRDELKFIIINKCFCDDIEDVEHEINPCRIVISLVKDELRP